MSAEDETKVPETEEGAGQEEEETVKEEESNAHFEPLVSSFCIQAKCVRAVLHSSHCLSALRSHDFLLVFYSLFLSALINRFDWKRWR